MAEAGKPAADAAPTAGESVSVKVSNLSASTTANDLRDHFAYAGTIISIDLRPGSDASSGYAYITFAQEKALETALLLSEASIKGSIVSVAQAEADYVPSPASAIPLTTEAPSSPAPPAPAPEASIKVTNLAASTTVKDLHDFFAYAGTISSIYLEPGIEGKSPEAHISFYEKKALDTALLLTDASIRGNIVVVTAAAPDYKAPDTAKFYPHPSQAAAAAAKSPVQRAETMFRKLLDQSYALGVEAVNKAKQFDDKHGLTRSATNKAMQVRESATAAVKEVEKRMSEVPGQVAASTQQVNRSISAVDNQYKVTEKTQGVFAMAEQRIHEAGEFFLENKYLAQGREWLLGTAAKVSDLVEGPSSAVPDTPSAPAADAPAAGAPAGHPPNGGDALQLDSVKAATEEAAKASRVAPVDPAQTATPTPAPTAAAEARPTSDDTAAVKKTLATDAPDTPIF